MYMMQWHVCFVTNVIFQSVIANDMLQLDNVCFGANVTFQSVIGNDM